MKTEILNFSDVKFGQYATIEQHRYGDKNEFYTHKVIGTSNSNSWVNVPVTGVCKETMQGLMEDVVWCICCGVQETEVLRYRFCDIKVYEQAPEVNVSFNAVKDVVTTAGETIADLKQEKEDLILALEDEIEALKHIRPLIPEDTKGVFDRSITRFESILSTHKTPTK